MFKPTPDEGSIFLTSLDRSHSLVLLFFCFFAFFLYKYIRFPFLVFLSPPACAQVQAKLKEKSPECQPMAQMAAKYNESRLGQLAPARIPGNYYGKYASSSFGKEFFKYTHYGLKTCLATVRLLR
jgi:hypothetical protein